MTIFTVFSFRLSLKHNPASSCMQPCDQAQHCGVISKLDQPITFACRLIICGCYYSCLYLRLLTFSQSKGASCWVSVFSWTGKQSKCSGKTSKATSLLKGQFDSPPIPQGKLSSSFPGRTEMVRSESQVLRVFRSSRAVWRPRMSREKRCEFQTINKATGVRSTMINTITL